MNQTTYFQHLDAKCKPNYLKAKQTGGFPNTTADYFTDKIINDHYEN